MIDLAAKLTLVVGLHVAIAVVWKYRTNAAWISLLFALVAFSIHYVVRIPLYRVVTQFLDPLSWDFVPLSIFWTPLIIWWVIFGIAREGVRWFTFRHVTTGIESWRDGVLFGIGYSSLSMLSTLGQYVPVHDVYDPLVPELSFIETINAINDNFLWLTMPFFLWKWLVIMMIFNVGTSVAVLFSVRRQNVWLLLAAVGLHILLTAAPWVSIQFPSVQLGPGAFLSRWSFMIFREIIALIAVLPALWLIFGPRKALDGP